MLGPSGAVINFTCCIGMTLTMQSPRRSGVGAGNLGYLLTTSEMNYAGSDVCVGIYIYIYICRWSIWVMSRSFIFSLIRKLPLTYASTSDQSNEL
jgi:hypothetical protein